MSAAHLWGARSEQRVAALHRQLADVDWMEAVHVLLKCHLSEHRLLVDVRRKGELHQHA